MPVVEIINLFNVDNCHLIHCQMNCVEQTSSMVNIYISTIQTHLNWKKAIQIVKVLYFIFSLQLTILGLQEQQQEKLHQQDEVEEDNLDHTPMEQAEGDIEIVNGCLYLCIVSQIGVL